MPPHASSSSSAGAHIALGIAPASRRAPYEVQVQRENGETLPTYAHRDRYYVQGNADERYVIRITNPTGNRIEAVVTVDGLDVIDGENGDLRKRGYIVPAYGETRIEGFRTSMADVATFRFSAVSDSYAAQKGKARNVGVIAVALFEERAAEPPPEIIGRPTPPIYRRPYRPYGGAAAPSANAAPTESRSAGKADSASATRSAEPAPPPSAAPPHTQSAEAGGYAPPRDFDRRSDDSARPARERLGLGTEFGEQRYSAVNYTQFVRAPGRPVAIAELRYNDSAGLVALGIPVQPFPDDEELATREYADPFPGDRFARPPGR